MESIIAAIIGGFFTVYAAKMRLDERKKETQSKSSGDRAVGATKYDLIIFIFELIVLVLFVYFVYYKFFWQLILQPIINYFK